VSRGPVPFGQQALQTFVDLISSLNHISEVTNPLISLENRGTTNSKTSVFVDCNECRGKKARQGKLAYAIRSIFRSTALSVAPSLVCFQILCQMSDRHHISIVPLLDVVVNQAKHG
jgi:hypothetical protein